MDLLNIKKPITVNKSGIEQNEFKNNYFYFYYSLEMLFFINKNNLYELNIYKKDLNIQNFKINVICKIEIILKNKIKLTFPKTNKVFYDIANKINSLNYNSLQIKDEEYFYKSIKLLSKNILYLKITNNKINNSCYISDIDLIYDKVNELECNKLLNYNTKNTNLELLTTEKKTVDYFNIAFDIITKSLIYIDVNLFKTNKLVLNTQYGKIHNDTIIFKIESNHYKNYNILDGRYLKTIGVYHDRTFIRGIKIVLRSNEVFDLCNSKSYSIYDEIELDCNDYINKLIIRSGDLIDSIIINTLKYKTLTTGGYGGDIKIYNNLVEVKKINIGLNNFLSSIEFIQ